ncbi:putative protease [Salado virus]|uniref:Putative protease n=1 Tax=Salado virus TaxID=2689364 RepID=A0A6B9KU51_9VIRU|nr:putative protease [Salado virus]QHA33837.1 putative protease [Salado virus]
MVINKSHADHMANRDKVEMHTKKINEYQLGELKTTDFTGKPAGEAAVSGIKIVNEAGITRDHTQSLSQSEAQVKRRTFGNKAELVKCKIGEIISHESNAISKDRGDDIPPREKCKDDGNEALVGTKHVGGEKNGFTRKRSTLVQKGGSRKSLGLQILNELSKSNSTKGINNPDDFDFLLWKGEPKALVTSVHFAQLLNFKGIEGNLNVQVSTVLEDNSNSANVLSFNQTLAYEMFRPEKYHVNFLPNVECKAGAKADMVKVVGQNEHVMGLSENVASKSIGTELVLLTGKALTKMNAIRSTPVDLRRLAVKAMLLKYQLTLIHAMDSAEMEFQARTIVYNVEAKKTASAVLDFPDKDMIIDVGRLSEDQIKLLLVLCSEWPSQKIMKGKQADIYSLIHVGSENFSLYDGQGRSGEIRVEGIMSTPKEYWSQVVQLFMNLGGLNDLVAVIRDNRGLAPILTYNACIHQDHLMVVGQYPMSKCYYGINVVEPADKHYIAPTILESSTMVLLVDQLMLSMYLNNVVYLCESLGFGSKTIFRKYDVGQNTKFADVLSCHNLTSVLPNSTVGPYLMPWLAPMGRVAKSCIKVIVHMANTMRNSRAEKLVCCALNYMVPTCMTVSSYSLIKNTQRVFLAELMGFNSDLGVGAELAKLTNWYNAISGNCIPKHGISILGTKHLGSDTEMVNAIFKNKGDYSIKRIVAITPYIPQKTNGSTLRKTFFYNPGYLEVQGKEVEPSFKVAYKTNSFAIKTKSNEPNSPCSTSTPELINVPNTKPAIEEKVEVVRPPPQTQSPQQDGVCTMLRSHLYTPYSIPTSGGNCGIDALVHCEPGIDKAEGLGLLGLTPEDGCWLSGDELAQIANAHGKDLIVYKPEGYSEYYKFTEASRPAVSLYFADHHYQPVKVDKTKNKLTKAVVAQLSPMGQDKESKLNMAKKIKAAQVLRGLKPRNIDVT